MTKDVVEHSKSRLRNSYCGTRGKGLTSRNASSKYLFSGLLIRAECVGRLAVVTVSRRNDHPRWGFPRNFSRGTCANILRERNDAVEDQLLEGLQKAILDPVAVEYAIGKFGNELERTLAAMTDSIETKRRRKDEIDVELSRLAEAVATQGASPALLNSGTPTLR